MAPTRYDRHATAKQQISLFESFDEGDARANGVMLAASGSPGCVENHLLPSSNKPCGYDLLLGRPGESVQRVSETDLFIDRLRLLRHTPRDVAHRVGTLWLDEGTTAPLAVAPSATRAGVAPVLLGRASFHARTVRRLRVDKVQEIRQVEATPFVHASGLEVSTHHETDEVLSVG